MNPSLWHDLRVFFQSLDGLASLARAESAAVRAAEHNPTPAALALLHNAHLSELNAIQAIVGRLDLLRQRHAELQDELRTADPVARAVVRQVPRS